MAEAPDSNASIAPNVATGARGFELTSQLFFDEALTDPVHAQSPYSQKGRRDTLITTDGVATLAWRAIEGPVAGGPSGDPTAEAFRP